jgi:hypothetical protein
LVATRFGVPRPWTGVRVALLCVAASFGFMVIANSVVEMLLAAPCGVAAVVTVEAAIRLRRYSEDGNRAGQQPRVDVGQCV